MRWVALLLVMAAFAGCLGDGESEGDDDPSPGVKPPDDSTSPEPNGDQDVGSEPENDPEPGSGDPDPGSGDPEPGEPANAPPAVTLSASNTTVDVGQTVDVTLDATDADNDTLSWDLDLDGDGEPDETGFADLPRTFAVSYDERGNVTIEAIVTDGTDTIATNITVSVVEPVAADEGPEPVVYAGTVLIPSPLYIAGASCTEDFLLSAATANTLGEVHNLPAEVIGWDFVVEGAGVVVGFFGAASSHLSSGGTEGTVPQGAEQMGVCGDRAVVTDYIVTLTAPAS